MYSTKKLEDSFVWRKCLSDVILSFVFYCIKKSISLNILGQVQWPNVADILTFVLSTRTLRVSNF